MLNKCGVYKITNKVTNQFYIGSSENVARRWSDHKTRYKDETGKEYNKELYVAIRQYGLENFNIEVIEECDESMLKERESYYIKELNAILNGYNGYGLDKHGKACLTKDDVINIRNRYNEHHRKKEVYKDYIDRISEKGFHKVWNGYTWPGIMDEVYTKENIEFHKNNTGQKGIENGKASLTEEDVISIRTYKKEGYPKQEVYEMYKDKVTKGSFTNTWCGYTWKHIVI